MLPCRAPWPPDRQSTGRCCMVSSKKNQRQPAIDPALLAEQTGLSVRQIQRYLRRIEASGWVSILPQHNVEGGQLPNLYDFSPFVTRLIDSLDGEEKEVRHG